MYFWCSFSGFEDDTVAEYLMSLPCVPTAFRPDTRAPLTKVIFASRLAVGVLGQAVRGEVQRRVVGVDDAHLRVAAELRLGVGAGGHGGRRGRARAGSLRRW